MCTGQHQNDKYSDLDQSDLQQSVGPITDCSQTRKMTVNKYFAKKYCYAPACLAIMCYLTDLPFLNNEPGESFELDEYILEKYTSETEEMKWYLS